MMTGIPESPELELELELFESESLLLSFPPPFPLFESFVRFSGRLSLSLDEDESLSLSELLEAEASSFIALESEDESESEEESEDESEEASRFRFWPTFADEPESELELLSSPETSSRNSSSPAIASGAPASTSESSLSDARKHIGSAGHSSRRWSVSSGARSSIPHAYPPMSMATSWALASVSRARQVSS